MFLQMNQEYKKITQGNISSIIKFIGAAPKVTSEATASHPYFYCDDYYPYEPKWANSHYPSSSQYYKDSNSWRVIPCITINLSKNGNN